MTCMPHLGLAESYQTRPFRIPGNFLDLAWSVRIESFFFKKKNSIEFLTCIHHNQAVLNVIYIMPALHFEGLKCTFIGFCCQMGRNHCIQAASEVLTKSALYLISSLIFFLLHLNGVNLPTFNNRLQHLIASFVLHRSVQLPLHHSGLSLPWDVCWLRLTQHAWSGRLDSLDQKTPKLYFFLSYFSLFVTSHVHITSNLVFEGIVFLCGSV